MLNKIRTGAEILASKVDASAAKAVSSSSNVFTLKTGTQKVGGDKSFYGLIFS